MQVKKIAAAVAASSLGFCAQGWALEPGVSPDIEIFMSGASAQDGNVRQLFEELCVGGTLDVYFDNSNPSNPGSAHTAIFCQIDSSKVTGLSVNNPKVLFHKRSAGGSAQGVGPVLDEQAIDAMMINNGNCQKDAASGNWLCRISQPGDLAQKVSDAGVSDVNPAMFRSMNTPDGVAPVDPAKVSQRLDVVSGGALVFNTPVTKSLRDALQRAQIDMGSLDPDCEGQDTERCMPSLRKYQIASLLTGNIGKWSEIKVVDKNGQAKGDLTQYANGSITDDKVYICRRVNGSGTQATTNANFLNAPCTDSALSPASTSNPLAGPVVILNSGAGNVDTCLDDFNQGTNNSKANAAGVKAWAIGVQSTERNANLKYNYRFIAIDGVAPTLANTASGHYMDWAENTYQWRKPAYNGPTGDKLKIIQKIASDAGSPSLTAKNNAAYAHPFGQGGYLAVTTAGNTPSADGKFDPNNPILPYSHAPGLSLDNCRVPVVNDNLPNRL
ncbi:hypothetical protein [Methylococcus capsulatus]|uniref:PBP domain-containing protein n=1 Tax=Methylococcus capsulatus TaxID=414 RepID=A0AA35UCM2_METCP|nr:hypothetical protein [Methylococcus capsulatus]QXP87182.1 hypothetical protein KW112_12500 [Methylococcus capsulatus]QXP93138.1 hypothetical protein KW113_12345 [Methylococcus capsulatus]UQN12175.1 hypothetical protein M3M30_14255 [Methylococcus capsulatus]CAI8844548.1 conserved exported protein of unknown function [Methylococcus capsulatus]